ncbi:MAG: hypothetical protein AAFW81_00790 [Pseudomonadota bacterium]
MTQSHAFSAIRVGFFASLAAALTACASDPDLELLREMPSYSIGYNDGCTTSMEEQKSFSTKTARDSDAFAEDEAYRFGWRQGYLQCNKSARDINDGGRILGERDEY